MRFASRANQPVGLHEHAIAFFLRAQEKADGHKGQAKQQPNHHHPPMRLPVRIVKRRNHGLLPESRPLSLVSARSQFLVQPEAAYLQPRYPSTYPSTIQRKGQRELLRSVRWLLRSDPRYPQPANPQPDRSTAWRKTDSFCSSGTNRGCIFRLNRPLKIGLPPHVLHYALARGKAAFQRDPSRLMQ